MEKKNKARALLWRAMAGIYCLVIQCFLLGKLKGESPFFDWLKELWRQESWFSLWSLLGAWGLLGVFCLLYALVDYRDFGKGCWNVLCRALLFIPLILYIADNGKGILKQVSSIQEPTQFATTIKGMINADVVTGMLLLVFGVICVALFDHFAFGRSIDWGIANVHNTRMLVFAALMVALARALSLIPSIPIFHTKLSFGFLARALCAMVCGPVLGLIYGFVEDILGFILQPSGEFFIGYTLSTMLGVLIYALCFYRRRVSVANIVLANLLVNLFVNALLGSVWNVMTRGNGNWAGYWGWFVPSLIKNVATIAPKAILLHILFDSMLPILRRIGVLSFQSGNEKVQKI